MAWKQFFREEKESWAATQLLMVKFPGNVLFCKATTGDTLSSLWSVGLLGNTLREVVKNGLFTVRLTLRGGSTLTVSLTVKRPFF